MRVIGNDIISNVIVILMPEELTANRFLIHGRVQGVGYRYFAQKAAQQQGVTGYARNLSDGSVEVYAVGSAAQISELAGMLRKGPPFSDVHSVERHEAAIERHTGFQIR
jgi:acylphosphatase